VILVFPTVELNDWIDEQGGVPEAAEKLGESKRAVASWYYAERAPGLKSAVNIVRKSEHRVDFNGIYWPIARKLLGLEKLEK